MISTYSTRPLSPNAPAIIRELRASFDERMMDLAREASAMLPHEASAGPDRTTHVSYTYGPLLVTAVYNWTSGQFTQLIARDSAEEGLERPSFTLSLFL